MGLKVLCPFHNDTQPSLHIYGAWSHCFTCGAHVKTSELPGEVEGIVVGLTKPYQEPVNISERVAQIRALPTDTIRGLQLHYDSLGYYIVWPDGSFYKRRNFEGKSRYTGPRGLKPPLLVYPSKVNHLILVEGELNAMSLYEAIGDTRGVIASPGSASEFMRHIKTSLKYDRVTLITDHDGAGIVYGVQCKNELLLKGKYCILNTLAVDFNELLQTGGVSSVQAAFEGVK